MMRKEVVDRIRELAERGDGTIKPEDVVADARDPSSPLHAEFQWDDDVAANAWRLQQARQLIRSVRIEFRVEKVTVASVQYVRDPRLERTEAGYIDVRKVKGDEETSRDVLLAEATRIKGSLERMRALAAYFDLQDHVDELIGELDEITARVSAVAAARHEQRTQ